MKKFIHKKLAYILAFFSLSFGFVSCNDLLFEEPISEIGPGSFWLNNRDAEAGVIAIYDAMQGAYRTRQILWGEWRADNLRVAGGSANINFSELIQNNVTAGNDDVLRWNTLYRMIYRANLAIDRIPTINGFNENFLGEAHALRAKAYFDAIRVWGNVPLFTEPTASIADSRRPVTNAEIIMNEVIIPDMLKAEQLISIPTRNFRYSSAAVFCLQAEVYMWLKDYVKAKEAIEKLINLREFSLARTVESWQNMFFNDIQNNNKLQFGPELIMSIRYSDDEEISFGGPSNNRSGIFQLTFGGIPNGFISIDLENRWRQRFPIDSLGWVTKYPNTPPALTRVVQVLGQNGQTIEVNRPVYGDWRYIWSREEGLGGLERIPVGQARIAKWVKINFSNNQDNTDIVLYRYAGMLLMLAEAENRLGNAARAFGIVNEIRAARLLPLVTLEEFGSTMDEREWSILEERRFELFSEGHRWWDLIRTEKVFNVMNPILQNNPSSVPLTQERLLFPIFINHLIDNPLLRQNPGY